MSEPAIECVQTVPARAALAGNPSDAYGGAVLAVPVRSVEARVTTRRSVRFVVGGREFGSPADLRAVLAAGDLDGLDALAAAAIGAFTATIGPPEPCRLEIATSIPRSVGLAGSSAVVIAVLRGLAWAADRRVPPPDDLAAIALAAEVDGLGIAAGPQDRVVQCRGVPTHMEFGGGAHETVSPGGPLPLFVAYRPTAAAPSGATHGPLRARFDRGDPHARETMAALATQARRATAATRSADLAELGAAIDRSFELRRGIIPLHPAHVEMVESARAAGAAANFAGSGGSVVVLAPDPTVDERARAALAAIGCRFLPVPLG